jgi:hypothetical protein
MIVHNPQALPPGNYSNKIQACGRHFYLQDGPACTYCPEQVVKIAGSCPSGKDTVLVGGTGLVSPSLLLAVPDCMLILLFIEHCRSRWPKILR